MSGEWWTSGTRSGVLNAHLTVSLTRTVGEEGLAGLRIPAVAIKEIQHEAWERWVPSPG